jgi:hypothetical protein
MLYIFKTLHFTLEKNQVTTQFVIRQYLLDFQIVASVQYFIAALWICVLINIVMFQI